MDWTVPSFGHRYSARKKAFGFDASEVGEGVTFRGRDRRQDVFGAVDDAFPSYGFMREAAILAANLHPGETRMRVTR